MGHCVYIVICVELFICQVLTQCLRPQSYNIVPRQMPDYIDAPRIIETPRYMEAPRVIGQPGMITEPYCNNIVTTNPIVQPSTTIITDCTPAVCKNLANTIQLMIVCNLLQNTKNGGDIALQMASPLLNELLATPGLSCGCGNPIPTSMSTPYISQNLIPSNIVNSRIISPNFLSGCPAQPVSAIQPNNGLLTSLLGLFGNGIQM